MKEALRRKKEDRWPKSGVRRQKSEEEGAVLGDLVAWW
jgi:hypothetical protein